MPVNSSAMFAAADSAKSSAQPPSIVLARSAGVTKDSLSFLLPVRHAALFRWCLAQGFRTSRLMTRPILSDASRGGPL